MTALAPLFGETAPSSSLDPSPAPDPRPSAASGVRGVKDGAVRARTRRPNPARPTRLLIRQKCRDCLCGYRYDCRCPDCSLYVAMPYLGIAMPRVLMDSIDRKAVKR
jgi:hypothetical protein